jgi:hypothetical protein
VRNDEPYRSPAPTPRRDEPAPPEEDPAPNSKELEVRYRALVGDEPNPMIVGLKRGLALVFVLLVSGVLAHACARGGCASTDRPSSAAPGAR